MFKINKKLLLTAALISVVAAGSTANAGTKAKDFVDHEFVNLPTKGLTDKERLELNRYLNYEHRELCQNYRMSPVPYNRTSCNLWRGKKMDYTLYFDTGSSSIREWTKVNEIVRAIKQHNPREVVIEGFTDTQGSAESNERLSMARTEAVKRALENKGIKTTIIASDYEGEYNQAVPTEDNVAHQLNRRVTVQLLK